MKKKLLATLLTGAVVLSTACGTTFAAEDSVAIKASFDIHVQADDWGCGVDKAILNMDQTLSDISAYEFSVAETNLAMNWETFQMEEATSDRTVTAVYLSDAEGNEVTEPSNFVTIEMAISPFGGSPYVTNMMNLGLNEWCEAFGLTITVTGGDSEITVAPAYTNVLTSADNFATDVYTAADGTTYSYATFTPEADSKTLVVWLHGLGEGGNDIKSVLLNAKVEALASDEFQSIMGGAYILAPQSPTYWMDNDGSASNYVNGEILADGTSVYTESLYELINSCKEAIGAEKVIIAGCSNGGYMAMILAMNYGNEFNAYVPICEAMADEFITDENIAALKDLNIFYIYAKNDPLVIPEVYEIPTIERLKAAGAENLHVFAPDDVHDTTGRFFGEDGEPLQQYGHGSWQYFFNNLAVCDEDGIVCWNWMSEQ